MKFQEFPSVEADKTVEKLCCSQSTVPLINGICYIDSSGTVRERFAVDAKPLPVEVEFKCLSVTV